MSDPDLSALRLLVRIDETGSLGRAAKACGIAQPNATRLLAKLERRVGQTLVMRSPGGSRLSDTGAMIAQWAVPLLDQVSAFCHAVEALSHTRTHELRVMASQTVAECYAPAWITAFRTRCPDTSVSMSVHNSQEIMHLQCNGDDRLGLVESITIRPGLSAIPIGYDQMVVVVAASHPWATRHSPIDMSRLATTPLVVRETGSGTREVLDHALRGHDRAEPVMVVSSNAGVIGSVAAGAGPTVISRRAALPGIRTGQLVEVEVSESRLLRRRLHAVWPTGTPLHGRAAEFLALMVRE